MNRLFTVKGAREVFHDQGARQLWNRLRHEFEKETGKVPPLGLAAWAKRTGIKVSRRDFKERSYEFRGWLRGKFPTLDTDWECSFSLDWDVMVCCLVHDLLYKLGGTKDHKREADVLIFELILERGDQRGWPLKGFYLMLGWHRFLFPWWLGGKIGAFNFD